MKTEVTADNLKDLVLSSAKIHEESWELRDAGVPDSYCYSKSIYRASIEACKEAGTDLSFAGIIEKSLTGSLEETIAWAG